MTFGQRLKQLRESKGLSQTDLSAAANVPPNTIRGLEQDQRTNPHWETVCALAAALGVSTDVFKKRA